MAKQEPDLWTLNADGTKDPFSNINWNMPDLPDLEDDQPNIDPVLQPALDPEVVSNRPAPVAEPVLEPEPDEPETLDLEDGTQLVLKKDKGWWVGSVIGAAGSPQTYKGQTKNQLILEVLKAQANATKKIREQNREIKLGKSLPERQAAAPEAPKPAKARPLTGDERFEIKTLWESDPSAAFDLLLQKTRGVTIDDILDSANEGKEKGSYAANTLSAEQVNKTFLANNPDYYPDPNFTNFGLIVKWLAKFKLGKSFRKGEEEQIFNELVATGNYTAENLEEAFKDLSDDDLLVRAPRQPNPPPPVVVEEPVPAPRPDSRIVSQVTRPRAALGIRPSDVTPVRTSETPNAPSAEDLEDYSDEQIAALMAGIRQQRARSRRSN